MVIDYICALDIGTTKICALIAEIDEHHQIKIIGMGNAPSDGLRRGARRITATSTEFAAFANPGPLFQKALNDLAAPI